MQKERRKERKKKMHGFHRFIAAGTYFHVFPLLINTGVMSIGLLTKKLL